MSAISGIDEMLRTRGFFRGLSILVSGGSGTGKTIFAAHFAIGACAMCERCIYFAFEESSDQIIRNMRSVGLNLEQHVQSGLLQFQAARPSRSTPRTRKCAC